MPDMETEPTLQDVMERLDTLTHGQQGLAKLVTALGEAQRALHLSHMELYGVVRKVQRDVEHWGNRQEVIIDALGALREHPRGDVA